MVPPDGTGSGVYNAGDQEGTQQCIMQCRGPSRIGGDTKENKGKEATFFQMGLETCQFSKPKYVYTLTLKSDKHSILSNM